MKKNYNFSSTLKIVGLALLSSIVTTSFAADPVSIIKTTVFSDDFERSDLKSDAPISYTFEKIVSVGAEADDPAVTAAGLLRLPNKKATGASGRNIIIADIATYTAPFNNKIADIDADSIVWAFNMRHIYDWSLDGFNDGQKGIATILLADGADLSTANGYAVVNGNNSASNDEHRYRYRLVKFTNGIHNNANIETIVNGETVGDRQINRSFMSFRVVFEIATNTWKFYTRVDGPNSGGAFANPQEGDFDYMYEAVDATFVNTAMTHFGFVNNYSGNVDFISFFDNYSLATYKTDVASSNAADIESDFYNITVKGNEIQIESENAVASLYHIDGTLRSSRAISGVSSIMVDSSGTYILKIESNDGQRAIEKLLF